jgi:hypothetical protein
MAGAKAKLWIIPLPPQPEACEVTSESGTLSDVWRQRDLLTSKFFPLGNSLILVASDRRESACHIRVQC